MSFYVWNLTVALHWNVVDTIVLSLSRVKDLKDISNGKKTSIVYIFHISPAQYNMKLYEL